MVGFLAFALRAPAPKPTKCDTIPNAYLFFSRKWSTSIDTADFSVERPGACRFVNDVLQIGERGKDLFW